MLRSPISRAFLLGAACLLAVAPFFWCGSPSGHDFEFHMFSWMDVLGQWKHGILYPRWAALAQSGYGEARFLFYPPVSWTFGAALGAALPWKIVPAAYCWIALTLAGSAMYRLARQWLPASSALFAAVFYALNPYHLLLVYWRSAYAELLTAALLPLLLLCLLRIFSRESGPGRRPALWLSLTLAAAWLTNEPAAIMIHYSVAVLALVLAALELAKDRRWSTQVWRPLARTALAVLFGAGLASFYLLPVMFERHWVNLGEVLSPGVRPQDNFLFTIVADPDHNRFNLLVSAIALAEVGALIFAILFSRKEKDKTGGTPQARSRLALRFPVPQSATTEDSGPPLWTPLFAWGALSAILMFSVSNFAWLHSPELRYVQLPFRWLLCMNAALAMLLAMATKRWTSRLLLSAFLLAVVIVAGYRIQPPWWDTAADIREMSDAVADGTGYEGTDEYVPAGDDSYELNKKLPLISDASGASVPGKILSWGPTEKHFTVHSAAPQNLTAHLFSYPAWQVIVNGKPVATGKTDVIGLIVIPIAAGDSDIRIDFRRTIDRLIGDIVSLLSLSVFVVVWLGAMLIKTRRRDTPLAQVVSPAA